MNNQTFSVPTTVLAVTPASASRSDPQIQLTIRTATGQTSTVTHTLQFAQHNSTDSRSGCPGAQPVVFTALTPTKLTTAASSVSLSTKCTASVPCAGDATLSSVFKILLHRKVTASRKKTRRIRLVLGVRTYTIRPGKRATIKVSLNKFGKRVLKRLHKLKTKLTLRTVSPTGKQVSSSRTVHFKVKKKKKPRRRRR